MLLLPFLQLLSIISTTITQSAGHRKTKKKKQKKATGENKRTFGEVNEKKPQNETQRYWGSIIIVIGQQQQHPSRVVVEKDGNAAQRLMKGK